MARLLWISLGGAVGTGLRYLLAGWVQRAAGPSFPYGTLSVNVIGSFVLGVLMVVGTETELMSPTVRLAVTTGAMGGFTTYSTFSYETLRLMQQGAWGSAALNIGVTLTVCLAASFLGFAVGRWVVGAA
ncbi:MAG: fluoride efflux transporter CrcB [Deltaproteobacteria bacterium]|nr:MAG: fluoride efflux transporter CrcB [Deltaproteobacteria bacterium]